jgi:hypothetical protein
VDVTGGTYEILYLDECKLCQWNKFYRCIKTVYVFIFLLKSALLCCFLITITFVSLNGVRRLRMCRKAEKVRCNVGIEGFLSLQLNWGQNYRFFQDA